MISTACGVCFLAVACAPVPAPDIAARQTDRQWYLVVDACRDQIIVDGRHQRLRSPEQLADVVGGEVRPATRMPPGYDVDFELDAGIEGVAVGTLSDPNSVLLVRGRVACETILARIRDEMVVPPGLIY